MMDGSSSVGHALTVHEIPGKPTCKYFFQGRCSKPAAECTFSHQSKPCFHFAKGNCWKGDKCPFDHTSTPAAEIPITRLLAGFHVQCLTMVLFPRRQPPLEDYDVEGTRESMQLMQSCHASGFALKSEQEIRSLEGEELEREEDLFVSHKPPVCSLLIAAAHAERHHPQFKVDEVQVVASRHTLRQMVHSFFVKSGDVVLHAMKCAGKLFLLRANTYEANDGDIGHQWERMVCGDNHSEQELRRVMSVKLGRHRILLQCETDAMEDDGVRAVEVKTLPPKGLVYPNLQNTWLQCVLAQCEVFVSARKEYSSKRDENPKARLLDVTKASVESSLSERTSESAKETMLDSIDRVLTVLQAQVHEGAVYGLEALKGYTSTTFTVKKLGASGPLPMTEEIMREALECGWR